MSKDDLIKRSDALRSCDRALGSILQNSSASAKRAPILSIRADIENINAAVHAVQCNYPNCDGGPATGYCHIDCRSAHNNIDATNTRCFKCDNGLDRLWIWCPFCGEENEGYDKSAEAVIAAMDVKP